MNVRKILKTWKDREEGCGQPHHSILPSLPIHLFLNHSGLEDVWACRFPVLTSALPVSFISRGVRTALEGEGDRSGSALSTWGALVSWELNTALFICGTSVAHRQNYNNSAFSSARKVMKWWYSPAAKPEKGEREREKRERERRERREREREREREGREVFSANSWEKMDTDN